jgi:hypothetical protein
MKIRKTASQRKEKLILEKMENDIYMDSVGKKYELSQINVEQDK